MFYIEVEGLEEEDEGGGEVEEGEEEPDPGVGEGGEGGREVEEGEDGGVVMCHAAGVEIPVKFHHVVLKFSV